MLTFIERIAHSPQHSARLNATLAKIAGFAGVIAACGGTATGSSGAPATPSVLSVGGSYQTQVSLLPDRNTCGAVTVQNNPTTVSHTPGARTLTLTHASNTYPGSIDSTGHFATTPTTLTIGASRYTVTITGQFNRTGFEATVQVGVQQPQAPQTCDYFVHWVGTKDGNPNTIP